MAIIPRLHRLLQPHLAALRPLVSLVDALPRRRLAAAINVADVRECARARAHRMVFGYLDSGADDGIALRRSNEAFSTLELHYRVNSQPKSPRPSLADHEPPVSKVLAGNLPTVSGSTHPRGRRIDLSTSLFGHKVGLPFFTAPTAGNRMFHCEGEVAVASVAEEFGMM